MDERGDAPSTDIAQQVRAHSEAIVIALGALKRQDGVRLEQDAVLRDQRKTIEAIAQQLNLMQALIVRALHPFVAGGAVHPAAGVLADQRDDAYLRSNPAYSEPDVFERFERDRLPVPPPENNESYAQADQFMWYWVWGLNNYMAVMKALRDHGVRAQRVFDFGGSTGRIARHFYCQDEPREVWWCDFKAASIQWCLQNFPPDMRMFLNTVHPHLPIPDGYFDLVTAFSVFTHIDELETAWLLELKRILRPGGMFYATIHDERSWELTAPDNALGQAVRNAPNGGGVRFDRPMPASRLAFPFTNLSHYNCNTFHTREYIRTNWGRFFDIVEIIPEGHHYQAVVVAINR